ncbi:MAG: GlsB/YeaQ/YmgE family stress response membrane protein [Gemmatimonadaceae bacterium]
MDLLTWLIVGLVAGLLASYAVGGIGYGLLGDIVVGMVGAIFGGWLFGALNVRTPFGGMAGAIFVAFIGAVVLLLILRALSTRGPRRPLWSRRRVI